METLKSIGLIIFYIVVASIAIRVWYDDNVRPHLKTTVFDNLKKEFRDVSNGLKGYTQFVISFESRYLEISDKDFNDTKVFKRELVKILQYEEFIRKTLADPAITLEEFQKKWNTYNLSDGAYDELINKPYHLIKGRDIDVNLIYDYLLNRVWPERGPLHPSKEDLEYAIFNANFKKFMQDSVNCRFQDYPLILVCKIREMFDDTWYKAVCKNLGMESKRITGWHRSDKAIVFAKDFPSNIVKY